MPADLSERTVEVIRTLVVLAIVAVTYVLIVDWDTVVGVWRQFVGNL